MRLGHALRPPAVTPLKGGCARQECQEKASVNVKVTLPPVSHKSHYFTVTSSGGYGDMSRLRTVGTVLLPEWEKLVTGRYIIYQLCKMRIWKLLEKDLQPHELQINFFQITLKSTICEALKFHLGTGFGLSEAPRVRERIYISSHYLIFYF